MNEQNLFARTLSPKIVKCNDCERKHQMKIYWEENQFFTIAEIVQNYCEHCTVGRYPPQVHDHFKQWEAYATP